MRDGTCPKCQSKTVHYARNGLRIGEAGRTILYPHLEPGFRGVVAPHPTDGLVQYACVTCGYLETHLVGEDAITFVRARWPAVPTQG